MSFSRMKPLPKILIIAAVVGGAVFAFTKFGPKPAPQGTEPPLVNAAPEPMVPPTAAAPQNQAPQVTPQPTPTPQPPVVQAPQPSPPANDAGLANVLGSTKK